MSGYPVPELIDAAKDVLGVLRAGSFPACLIGGFVLPRWGQPRATTDVDLSVLASYGDEGPVLNALLDRFKSRRPDARAFALQNRVLLLLAPNGVKVDLALAAFPFELEALDRASNWAIMPSVILPTCSAEDLIVYKLVAGRGQDLIDVEGVVRRQGKRLDIGLIRRWGRVFAELKEDPDLLQPFEHALAKVGS